MSLEINNKNIETTKEQKRTGFADLKHTKTVNAKETITLKKTLVLRNRKSVVTDSDNVFEVLFAEDPGEKENYIFIGRHGVLGDEAKMHTSYIEITANSDTSKISPATNGRITMSISHDKDTSPTRTTNFEIVDSAAINQPAGSVAVYMLARGANGLSGIGFDVANPSTPGEVDFSLFNLARKLYLGATLQPYTTNLYDIGTSALRIKTIYTVNSVDVSSDIRFKKNIKKLPYGLKEVKKINPISYTRDGQKHLGFSAQELRKILPEIVTKDRNTHLSIRPDEIIPVLLSAIKELSNRLDALTIGCNTGGRSNRSKSFPIKSGSLNSVDNRISTATNRRIVNKHKTKGKKGDKRFKK